MKRFAWFAALYVLSVVAVAATSWVLRAALKV